MDPIYALFYKPVRDKPQILSFYTQQQDAETALQELKHSSMGHTLSNIVVTAKDIYVLFFTPYRDSIEINNHIVRSTTKPYVHSFYVIREEAEKALHELKKVYGSTGLICSLRELGVTADFFGPYFRAYTALRTSSHGYCAGADFLESAPFRAVCAFNHETSALNMKFRYDRSTQTIGLCETAAQ